MNKSIIVFFLILIGFTAVGYILVEVIESNTPLPIYGPENHVVGDFILTDQRSQTFESKDYHGRIWIVNSFFTSCPIVCPKVMKNLQEVHELMRSDESVVTISLTVDPKRDSPERLLQYAKKYNANNDSWFLLTGEKKDLYLLARKDFLLSASDGAGDEGDFIHSENVLIIDPDHRIRDILNGTDPRADEKIFNAVKKLKSEYKI